MAQPLLVKLLPIKGGGVPHVILKAVVGSDCPLDPGNQHKANWADEIKNMCEKVQVHNLIYANKVFPAYEHAIKNKNVHLIIEHGDLYSA